MTQTISIFVGRQSHFLGGHFFNLNRQIYSESWTDDYAIFEEVSENIFRPRALYFDFQWSFPTDVKTQEISQSNKIQKIERGFDLEIEDEENLPEANGVEEIDNVDAYYANETFDNLERDFANKETYKAVQENRKRNVCILDAVPSKKKLTSSGNALLTSSYTEARTANELQERMITDALLDQLRLEMESTDTCTLHQITGDWTNGFSYYSQEVVRYLMEEQPKTSIMFLGVQETPQHQHSFFQTVNNSLFLSELGTSLMAKNSIALITDASTWNADHLNFDLQKTHHNSAYLLASALNCISSPFRLNPLFQQIDTTHLLSSCTSTRNPFNGLQLSFPFPGDITKLKDLSKTIPEAPRPQMDRTPETTHCWTAEKTPLHFPVTGEHPAGGTRRLKSHYQLLTTQGLPMGAYPFLRRFVSRDCEHLSMNENPMHANSTARALIPNVSERFALTCLAHGGSPGEAPSVLTDVLAQLKSGRNQIPLLKGREFDIEEVFESLELLTQMWEDKDEE